MNKEKIINVIESIKKQSGLILAIIIIAKAILFALQAALRQSLQNTITTTQINSFSLLWTRLIGWLLVVLSAVAVIGFWLYSREQSGKVRKLAAAIAIIEFFGAFSNAASIRGIIGGVAGPIILQAAVYLTLVLNAVLFTALIFLLAKDLKIYVKIPAYFGASALIVLALAMAAGMLSAIPPLLLKLYGSAPGLTKFLASLFINTRNWLPSFAFVLSASVFLPKSLCGRF